MNDKNIKIAFCTCVQIGRSCIEGILDDGQHFDLFLSLPDDKSKKKSGRIYLDDLAQRTNTPLVKVNHINDPETVAALKKYEIDWLFVIGWSQICSPEIIETPEFGVIGAHPTLLPKGRGRAAVPWAILKGLDKTGVTFFKMDRGVDTGLILEQFEIPLALDETATDLYEKVNRAHVDLIRKIWPKLISGNIDGIKQDESQATVWPGRTPADGELNDQMTLEEVDRLVRATTRPYPGAFIRMDGRKYIIWSGEIGPTDGLHLDFKDGIYTGLDYTVE